MVWNCILEKGESPIMISLSVIFFQCTPGLIQAHSEPSQSGTLCLTFLKSGMERQHLKSPTMESHNPGSRGKFGVPNISPSSEIISARYLLLQCLSGLLGQSGWEWDIFNILHWRQNFLKSRTVRSSSHLHPGSPRKKVPIFSLNEVILLQILENYVEQGGKNTLSLQNFVLSNNPILVCNPSPAGW